MSKPTFINSSVVYHDNSKEYNIDARGNKDIGDLIRACNIDAPQVQDIASAEPIDESEPVEQVATPPKFFCVSEKFPEQNIRDRLAAELSHSVTKREYCRALYQLQHIGCINIDQYASDEKRAEVFNKYQSTYKLSASDFCKARASYNKQN